MGVGLMKTKKIAAALKVFDIYQVWRQCYEKNLFFENILTVLHYNLYKYYTLFKIALMKLFFYRIGFCLYFYNKAKSIVVQLVQLNSEKIL